MTLPPSRTAEIRAVARTDDAAAGRLLAGLLADLFGLAAEDVAINRDQYSLNSLNGFFRVGPEPYFFKFHQEEGEEAMSGEYYRADLLAAAGLPVDMPVWTSTLPGEQILVYRRRADPRFSDVLRALDLSPDPAAEARAVEAERGLCREIRRVYLETLHPVTPAEVAAEPIHRLFHDRMIDPATGATPGGRWASFYVGKPVRFPGLELPWDTFAAARFEINGRRYSRSVGELFEAAVRRLAPLRLADACGVTAHGDAHNANVWYSDRGGRAQLSFFDPAFAGRNVPSLIAEVKATFHNALAHPFWLYDPDEAARRFSASATYADGTLKVTTDFAWSPLRLALLQVKAEEVWRPLVSELRARAMLPADWQDVVRLALFCCPTLVMNLRAGAATHNETSSLIAFSVAVMAGCAPENGEDAVTEFLRVAEA